MGAPKAPPMSRIPDEIVTKILDASNVFDVISDFCTLEKSGNSFNATCPLCGKSGKGKGLKVTKGKGIYKCFSCGFGGNSATKFLMETEKMSYPDTLKWLADKYQIAIEAPKPKLRKDILSFCKKQLMGSGLTEKDITAQTVHDDNTVREVLTFQKGTRDQYGNIDSAGDDMIIWYYNLEGKQVMYQKPKSNKSQPLFRVRWQNPDLHCDRNGNPMKYQSPYGSGTHIYIPQIMRDIYQNGRQIKRLFLQEGEKKAEKACKHGLPSVGLQGINTIGSKNGKLPYEIQQIIQRCGVKEVVFVFDSDWNQLSKNLNPAKPADQRPRNFYYALKNYRDYFKTFNNQGIFLELYFASFIHTKDKGIDDLLVNTLFDNPEKLREDIEFSINEKNGTGTYVQVDKITASTDGQLLQYFGLQSVHEFYKIHERLLQPMPQFIYGNNQWRWNPEKNALELAQPLTENETFWEETTSYDAKGAEKVKYQFDYENAYNFLQNRGYGRIMMENGKWQFCHLQNNVVRIVEAYQIKDFIISMAKEIAPKVIRNMLYRGGKMYFGPDSLSHIDFIVPEIKFSDKNYQYLFFKETVWKITSEGITEKHLRDFEYQTWSDKVKRFDIKKLPFLMEVTQIQQEHIGKSFPNITNTISESHLNLFLATFSDEGMKCHYAQFLWNSSDFYWEKHLNQYRRATGEDERTMDDIIETCMHFLSKVTAIGYLMHKYRNRSCEKAVIAMDGTITEVGRSEGRTGKSLMGEAISKIIPTVYIPAKHKDITEDKFLFEEVTEKTDAVWLDDVRANIDFEFFFPMITGRMPVNQKGIGKFTLPPHLTPKLFLCTNHAIAGGSGSFKDREMLLAFSNYYSDKHKPTDDFGVIFWEEWDENQMNLFYNFMAQCLQMYLKYGLIQAPMERLEQRRIRQEMGEVFLLWADEYFSNETRMNTKIPRKELNTNYLDENPTQRKYTTAHSFKKRIKLYCTYKGYRFNPVKQGDDDKTGGVEYFTIANELYV